MKILYAVPRYAPFVGGVETHVSRLATNLAAQGHEVDVASQESDSTLPAVELIDGVLVRRFPIQTPRGAYPFAPGVWRYLARTSARYDLVHAHGYHAFPAIGAGLFAHAPLVFTPHYHGPGHSGLGRILHVPYRSAGSRVMRRSRAVICVSESEANLVRRHFQSVSGRITVIPNGVDLAALREAQPYEAERKVILTAGRLLRYKNVRRVIEALTLMPFDFELHVVGTGPDEGELREIVARHGLESRVHFHGQVPDVELRRWYRTAEVYITLSEQEAFGLTPIEALAAGTPVVASDIPAHRDATAGTSSDDLILLPADAATDRIAAAIRQASKRRVMAGLPPTAMSWEEMASRTMRVYEAVLGNNIVHS